MTRDVADENIASYRGERARQDWTADIGLYPIERQVITEHFPAAPAKILDIGCGGGRTTFGLEELGYDVEAFDLSEDLVDEARKRLRRTRVQVMDARHLEYESSSFDAVMFSYNGLDCVHPSAERARVLDEVHRVLRPGARFYYSGHCGLAAWGPRGDDSFLRLVRRDLKFLGAQRRRIAGRRHYLVYPDAHGGQVLYSALPHVHLREIREHGFRAIAVYGSRSYRNGPHIVEPHDPTRSSVALVKYLARISVSCPHVHYIVEKNG